MSVSLTKVIGMAGTVILTSGDDALWLVPFIASPLRSPDRQSINMSVWFLSLLSLVFAAQIVVACGVKLGSAGFFRTLGWPWSLNVCLSLVGVIAAWVIAFVFLLRWVYKRWQKSQKHQRMEQMKAGEETSLIEEVHEYDSVQEKEVPRVDKQSLQTDIWTVMSLTITGGIDEVAYFPSLLLTNVVSFWEMLLGTVLAGFVLLIVLKCCLAFCTPVLKFMDRIPLWLVVSIFASVMTIFFFVELSEVP